jgi:hypothetical protein
MGFTNGPDNDNSQLPPNKPLNNYAPGVGTISAVALGHVLRMWEPRSMENRTTVDPVAPSSMTARHNNNTSEHDVELGIQPRGGQVCPYNVVVLVFMMLT